MAYFGDAAGPIDIDRPQIDLTEPGDMTQMRLQFLRKRRSPAAQIDLS